MDQEKGDLSLSISNEKTQKIIIVLHKKLLEDI